MKQNEVCSNGLVMVPHQNHKNKKINNRNAAYQLGTNERMNTLYYIVHQTPYSLISRSLFTIHQSSKCERMMKSSGNIREKLIFTIGNSLIHHKRKIKGEEQRDSREKGDTLYDEGVKKSFA